MTPEPIAPNPYQNLYIYYLSGRFNPGPAFKRDDYIGSWEEGDFSFLFFTRPSERVVQRIIADVPGLDLVEHYHMTYDQWQGSDIVPSRIGPFTVSPPWFATSPEKRETTIVLDPGVVFGTGTHPTTRDCMAALAMALSDGAMRTVLDLGTGTGLLALAAARLSHCNVLATDLTFLAAKTAKRNVHLNGLESRILVAQGDAHKFIDFKSDLVVSNIHYEVMKEIIRTKGFLSKKRFILSGLMRKEAARVESVLRGLPIKILRCWDQDGIWTTFYGAMT